MSRIAREDALKRAKDLVALAIDNDGSLHYQLARALQSNGEESRAKEMMSRYEQLSKAAGVGTSGTEAQITPP